MDVERARSIATIAAECGVSLETGRRLADLTSLGVGGEIRTLLRPRTVASLASLLGELHGFGIPFRVLGGGANVVGGPGPFEDPVILTRTIRQEPAFEGAIARAGGGFNIKRFVRACAARGLAGLEWAEGIPGTMGGAIVMNAGSYGGQMSDHVVEVEWLAPDGTRRRRHVGPGDFDYRTSPFRSEGAVVETVFSLLRDDVPAIEARLREFQARRTGSQPPGERSAGCIFRNPPGDSAGRVIDAAGLKGLSVGGASVSEVHANFVVNRGDATSEDLFVLIGRIQEEVARRTGIVLQEEVIRWL
ncbi:MAG: UDP-N-acetylmuramate dehydrogenase [Acidobacteria bacterium]|nr:UDP-N-acetylmuramate dehydrogenase [Acidobacteriota bacterium]